MLVQSFTTQNEGSTKNTKDPMQIRKYCCRRDCTFLAYKMEDISIWNLCSSCKNIFTLNCLLKACKRIGFATLLLLINCKVLYLLASYFGIIAHMSNYCVFFSAKYRSIEHNKLFLLTRGIIILQLLSSLSTQTIQKESIKLDLEYFVNE